MICKDKTNLPHLHITQIISSCLSGRLKFRLSWPISIHMHASVPHPFSSKSLCSIHLSFFSSWWDIVCFQRQSTFSQCSDWLILRQKSKVMFRGPDLQWNACVGVVIRIHLRDFFFLRRAGVKTVEVLCPDWNILWVCLCHYVICLTSFVKWVRKWHYKWLQLILREFPIVYKQIFFYLPVLM